MFPPTLPAQFKPTKKEKELKKIKNLVTFVRLTK